MNLLNICTKIILISFFSFSIGFCDEKMNDFFDNNPEKRWIFFADTVMGGKSSGKVVFRNQNGMNYAHLSGTVTTENNGGFIQIRKKISGLQSNVSNINIKVKGNNQIYHVFLRTSGTILPWQYYKVGFKAKNNWEKISIPISKFERSSNFLAKHIKVQNIKSIGLVAYGRNFNADLYVTEVTFQ